MSRFLLTQDEHFIVRNDNDPFELTHAGLKAVVQAHVSGENVEAEVDGLVVFRVLLPAV